MKVHIGPYTNWFGPYQLAEKLMFWVPKQKDEYGFLRTADRVHNFGEWLAHGSIEPEPEVGSVVPLSKERHNTWIYRFLLWLDKHKKRRIQVNIDPWDTWSMDNTLAHIVLPMLKQLKQTKHGSPLVDDEDVPEHLRSTSAAPKENDYDVDDNHHDRWDWVLDEMIFAFTCSIDDSWEDQFHSGNYDYAFKKLDNGMSEMIKIGEGSYDFEGRKEFQKRISNGFRLFGKYYQSLWN
jgi:hypothetical protein